jgi:hypothetical protein
MFPNISQNVAEHVQFVSGHVDLIRQTSVRDQDIQAVAVERSL